VTAASRGRRADVSALLTVAVALGVVGCASHSERLLPVRTALDEGNPREAIAVLNKEMDVKTDADLPADMGSDHALFVLDRATIQQSVAQFPASKRDFESADKAIDMLDLAHDAGDTIGEYVFSGSSGRYQAPPYEKLLINTLDMLNYLELRDLAGARVEARRLAVMQRYVADDLHETDNSVLGLGGLLAGVTFEQSDQADEALRWYDEALAVGESRLLREPVQRLLQRGHYRTPRLSALESKGSPPPALEATGEGEVLLVVGYGRVPHKIAERVPIGLALTYFSGALAPHDVAAANRLAAQGLVTWINFPTLGEERGGYGLPGAWLDGRDVPLEEAVNVTREVRAEWKKIEGRIIVSAITRMVARYAAGSAVQAAAGHDLLGTLLSLGTQATLTALDRPDTRSWETLPARVAVGRVRVPAGRHTVRLVARGATRDVPVDVDKGGCAVVSLMALR
jgi:hypothetical protein